MIEASFPRIDVPEAYEGDSTVGYGRIESGDEFLQRSQQYSLQQQAQVSLEAGMLGVNPYTEPDKFIEAHNTLLKEMHTELNADFPAIKQQVVERTARYFGRNDEATQQGIIDLLTTRLADTEQLHVIDNLITDRGSLATFDIHRQPVLTSRLLMNRLNTSRDAAEFCQTIGSVEAAHEVMHGMFTSGVQRTWLQGHEKVRNGLSVTDIDNPLSIAEQKKEKHAEWLNEATLESFRQTIMETDVVRYEPGVMVLHMLDELSPGLRDELVLAALDSSGPGPTFGKIESLLGPTAIEDVGELLTGVTDFAGLEPFKDAVARLLPKDLQEKGRQILEEKQEEVLGWQPDYHEKRQRQLEQAALQT